MQQQIDWSRGKLLEGTMVSYQAAVLAGRGRLEETRELYSRGGEMFQRENLSGIAEAFRVAPAVDAALFGKCQDISKDIASMQHIFSDLHAMAVATVALSLCGEFNQAQSLIDKAIKQYPRHTILNELYRPIALADIAIHRGNPAKAIENLKSALRYEEAEYGIMAKYFRGQAFLLLGDGDKATVEFQKVLDRIQLALFAPQYSLAHLGVARAARLSGDIAKSKKYYQDFLAIMKDADDDLPVIKDAEAEYADLLATESTQ
jgi:tetratricopeptide (TPR) repeat protein